jgi:hypothetical protein
MAAVPSSFFGDDDAERIGKVEVVRGDSVENLLSGRAIMFGDFHKGFPVVTFNDFSAVQDFYQCFDFLFLTANIVIMSVRSLSVIMRQSLHPIRRRALYRRPARFSLWVGIDAPRSLKTNPGAFLRQPSGLKSDMPTLIARGFPE